MVDARTRVLILGSLPGEASLAAGRYYAHPRNLFWRLVGDAIGSPLDALAYEDRLIALQSRGVGLWDTVAQARREGSLDSAIKDAVYADLPALVARLPSLRAVAFNGATAAKMGYRQLAGRDDGRTLIALPSSSPAHASMTFETKLAAWRAIAAHLTPPSAGA